MTGSRLYARVDKVRQIRLSHRGNGPRIRRRYGLLSLAEPRLGETGLHTRAPPFSSRNGCPSRGLISNASYLQGGNLISRPPPLISEEVSSDGSHLTDEPLPAAVHARGWGFLRFAAGRKGTPEKGPRPGKYGESP